MHGEDEGVPAGDNAGVNEASGAKKLMRNLRGTSIRAPKGNGNLLMKEGRRAYPRSRERKKGSSKAKRPREKSKKEKEGRRVTVHAEVPYRLGTREKESQMIFMPIDRT